MIVVAIIGALSSVAVPAFMRYINKSRSAEARGSLKRIYDGARTYFMDPNFISGFLPLPAQFPATADGGAFIADANCCASALGGTGLQCVPSPSLWANEAWTALTFSHPEPHYYAYAYTSSQGAGAARDGSHRFTAFAQGDLNCNGIVSEFSIFATVNSQFADGPAGSASIRRVRPLE